MIHKEIIDMLRPHAISFVDWLVSKIPRREVPSSIALIRMDAIGDFIIWLDTAKRYRDLYPGKKITLIANAAWKDLATLLPYWDEVWPVNVHRLARHPHYRLAILLKTRRAGFETAIQPTFSRVALTGDSLVRASGARYRIGSTGDCNTPSSSWYSWLIPASPKPMMELERNTEFIKGIGVDHHTSSIHQLPVLVELRQQIKLEKPYFIIFPGASWVGKQWPRERFVSLIREMHNQRGGLPVLCGSKSEYTLCSEIAEACGIESRNIAGLTSLPEFAEIIRHADILIGNDTAAVHIAAAVNTPSVCIVGGGHFGRFMPYSQHLTGISPVPVWQEMNCFGCGWLCTQQHLQGNAVPCISSISVDAVLLATNHALDSIFNTREIDTNLQGILK